MAEGNSIRHLVDAREVADVVVFLCSPKSVAINGDAIAAGGGAPRSHPLLSGVAGRRARSAAASIAGVGAGVLSS